MVSEKVCLVLAWKKEGSCLEVHALYLLLRASEQPAQGATLCQV